MAFKTFSTKQELFDIINSVDDTVIIDFSEIKNSFTLIKSFGFIQESLMGMSKSKIEFYFKADDEIISISFSNPGSKNGICYLLEKQFLKKVDEKFIYHRENELPAYITYHANGNRYQEKYSVNGTCYSEIVLNGVQYFNLETISTSKNKKVFEFTPKNKYVKHLILNPKTLKPLRIVYHYEGHPKNTLFFDDIKKVYPDICRLSYVERLDLSNLSKEELAIIDILLF